MKIINREKFMELPPGTFYIRGVEWYWQQMSVKGETLKDVYGKNVDWYRLPLDHFAEEDTGGPFDVWINALRNGASFTLNTEVESRDGRFDNDDIFMIFEYDDLKLLGNLINTALRSALPVKKANDPNFMDFNRSKDPNALEAAGYKVSESRYKSLLHPFPTDLKKDNKQDG